MAQKKKNSSAKDWRLKQAAKQRTQATVYNPKYKLLYYGDSPKVRTGFGRVAFEILSRLYRTGKYEIHCVGINDRGDPTDFQGPGIFHYPLPHLREDPYGQARLPEVLAQVKPNVMFVLQDIWVLEGMERNGTKNWFISMMKKTAPNLPWVLYFPVDSRPWKKAWAELAYSADKTVVYAKYAIDVLKEIAPDEEPLFIPHGVDLEGFKIVPDELRNQVRQSMGVAEDQFMVGFVSRNQPRKNPAAAFEIFKMANEGYRKCTPCGAVRNLHDPRCEYCGASHEEAVEYPSVLEGKGVFYPHFNWKDGMGIDMQKVVDDNGGAPNILVRHNHNVAYGLPQQEFNAVLNALDCQLLTTMAEGFGLSVAECMAAGVVNIATRTTAVTEQLEEGRGHLILPKSHIIFDDAANTRKHIIDYEDAIKALASVYEDWKNRGEERWGPVTKEMVQKGLAFCRDHNWNDIAKEFEKVFEDAMQERVSLVNLFEKSEKNFMFARPAGTVGEVLQTLAPIRKIREENPDATMYYALPKSCVDVLDGHFTDLIDGFIRVDRMSDFVPRGKQPPRIVFFDMMFPETKWESATYPYNDKAKSEIYCMHIGVDSTYADLRELGVGAELDLERGLELKKAQVEKFTPGNDPNNFTVCLIPEATERRKSWGDGVTNWADLDALCSKIKGGVNVVTINSNKSFMENLELAANCDLVVTVDNAYCDFLCAINHPTVLLISSHFANSRFYSFDNCAMVTKEDYGTRVLDPPNPNQPSQLVDDITVGEVGAKVFSAHKKWKKERA